MSSKTQTPTRVLFDVPGPKGRRRIWIISVLAVLVFVAAAAGGIYQLWWNYQLLPEKWLPFTQPATLKFFGRGVVGTLLQAWPPSSPSHWRWRWRWDAKQKTESFPK